MRAAWQKAKARYEPELRARGTEAHALLTDATAVAKAASKYLNAIEVLGDPDEHDPGNAAKRDLSTILTKIAARAQNHQSQARTTMAR